MHRYNNAIKAPKNLNTKYNDDWYSLGIIQIIFEVNFNHPEEGSARQKGVGASLKV